MTAATIEARFTVRRLEIVDQAAAFGTEGPQRRVLVSAAPIAGTANPATGTAPREHQWELDAAAAAPFFQVGEDIIVTFSKPA